MKNDASNIVELTASEHFKAHYYLWKHYADETNDKNAAIKMLYPIIRMYKQVSGNMTDEEIESVSMLFEEARIAQGKAARARQLGVPCKEEVKMKISATEKGKFVSEESRRKMSKSQMGNKNALNHKMSDESIRIMSAKLRQRFSGENNPAFGRHWYTNGIVNKYLHDTECPEGFWAGMTKKRKEEETHQ